jgi:hypothetical protein
MIVVCEKCGNKISILPRDFYKRHTDSSHDFYCRICLWRYPELKKQKKKYCSYVELFTRYSNLSDHEKKQVKKNVRSLDDLEHLVDVIA